MPRTPGENSVSDNQSLDRVTDVRRVGSKARGTMIQGLVFVNGLILSVTAFLALNVFIEQMRVDYIDGLQGQARTATTDVLNNIARDMLLLSEMNRLSPERTPLKSANIEELLTNQGVYDRVILFRRLNAGRWGAQDVYMREDALNRHRSVIGLPANDYAEMLVPLRTAGDQMIFKPFPQSDYNGFVALKGVWQGNVMIGAQAFFVNMRSYFESIPGFDIGVFPALSVSQEGGAWPLYQHGDDRVTMYAGEEAAIYSRTEEFQVKDKNISLSASIKKSFEVMFLMKIPYLIMLFGMTLTMIGTLYVRNNQKQARKLSEAAIRLREKNDEMSTQTMERERLFRALQKSETEYKNVINAVSDILFELSERGEIKFLNEAWERITGIGRLDVIGDVFFDFLSQEDHKKLNTLFDEMLQGVRPGLEHVTRLKTYDNQWRTVELRLNAIRTQGDMDSVKIIGTMNDIEDQTRADHALSEVEERYKAIVENAQSGIYQVKTDGKLISANLAMARILGFESSNALIDGTGNISDLYTDMHERARYERELKDIGFIRNMETRIRRHDGKMIWVSESARAVHDADGEIKYFEGSLEDITQRKETEIALREAKIQSDLSSRAKSEFLANMSHELRTPLNAIIGFSEIIKTEAMGPLGQPAYSEYAQEIFGSGQQLLSIINEILDISKIDAGERALNEGLVNMQKVIESCVHMQSSKLVANKLSLQNNIDSALPAIVGEELAFKQILLNLLSNAIKFTGEGGQITLGYDYRGPGADLHISITDTGIGIDENDIPKAFSAFGQIDNSLDRNLSGTGLGLTLSQALIQMHGGRIEIVSQKGVGTTVSIIVPARRVSQNAGKSEEGRSNVRVLNPRKPSSNS